jgi:uncharacterized protein YlxW (UPF0749 family)
MKQLSAQLALTFLCFLLGILLVSQFRTQERLAAELRAQSPQHQLTLLGSLIDANARLREEVAKLEQQVQAAGSTSAPALGSMSEELAQLQVLNGLAEARGPGVRVTLDADLETYWLHDLLNELRNAGAQGISLNGRRVLAGSAVSGAARQISLDGQPVARPYVIEAVGDQETLATALGRPGGPLLQLRAQYGAAAVALTRQAELRLAAHPAGPSFRLGQPLP